jgi:cation diffusion facilitator family transporter
MSGDSRSAIFVALGANLAIAVAKFAGAAVTGSAAMLSEGVHSVVDTSNQGLLLFGMKQAEKKPDARHPFGYGREVYFYSFVVALLIFSAGGVYSMVEGIEKIGHPEMERSVTLFGRSVPGVVINLAILVFSLIAEGYSFYAAFRALPTGGLSPLSAIRRSKDPSLFVVLAEDTAAVIGLVLALLGVGLSHALAMPVLDGVASVAIGIVLIGMAFFLMVETHGLLIGEGASPDLVEAIRALAREEPGVHHINEILTQHLGPADILVNISLDVRDNLSAVEVENLVSRFDAGLRRRSVAVRRIFIEIQSREASDAQARALLSE